MFYICLDLLAASSYDIRYSRDIKELRHSFENASQLNDGDVMSGNLSSPVAPSETETAVIRFPATHLGQTLFFGVKVDHSVNRRSDVSNIVSAAIIYVPPESQSTTAATYTVPTPEPEVTHLGISAQALLAIKITFAIGVPVMVLVAIVLAIKVVRRENDSRKSKRARRHTDRGKPNNNEGSLPYTIPRINPYIPRPAYARGTTFSSRSQTDTCQQQIYSSIPLGGLYYNGNNYYEPKPDY